MTAILHQGTALLNLDNTDAATATPLPPDPTLAAMAGPVLAASSAPGHLVINATYDSTVTSQSSTIQAEYKSAAQAAIQVYENAISSPITLNITFGYGDAGGQTITSGAVGESNSNYFSFTYAQLIAAVKQTETTSAVQKAAVASLPASDPTGGGTFLVTVAEAQALGLVGSNPGSAGGLGLSSSLPFSWSQSSVASGTYDATGVLEHEISEILGRGDFAGKSNQYSLLDLFRYTAADGGSGDAPGAAAGLRDQPFVAGYSTNAASYFSPDGKTISLQYDTPSYVAAGDDVADWSSAVANDAFGFSSTGQAETVTPADLTQINVMGYSLACFAAGTRIRTPAGDIAVEHLRAGQILVLARGGTASIRWIGHRRVDLTRLPDRRHAQPVRIAAAAFGPGMPARDLLLSPEHAVFWGGVLAPARHLAGCGGVTIDHGPDAIEYFHIELDRHDAILAERLPCETWLDTGNRAMFSNAPTAPTQDAAPPRPFAPIVESGPDLEAIRRHLAQTRQHATAAPPRRAA